MFLLTYVFVLIGILIIYGWQQETDADPHDARRGFFFAHVGWLFLTPHPEVVAKRKIIDLSDLENDPIVMWQKRLNIPLFALISIAMPVLVCICLPFFFHSFFYIFILSFYEISEIYYYFLVGWISPNLTLHISFVKHFVI